MFHFSFSTIIIAGLIIAFIIIAYANFMRRRNNKKLSDLNEKLLQSEEKYKLVVEESPNIMFIQKDGKILFANKQFIEMSGFTMDELKEISIFDLVSPEDKLIARERADKRLSGKNVPDEYEVKAINKNGITRYFILHLSLTEYNGESAILGIGTDISAKKKNLETIRKLRVSIEQSNAVIFIFDTEGVIDYANNAFCEQTGYSMEEAIGMNVRMLNPKEFKISESEEFWNYLRTGKKWEGEFKCAKKNGELYWEKALVSPIFDASGQITHYTSITNDITREKTVIRQLKKREAELNEANATKDRFFSIIGHDLKNPFNAIMGYTSLLLSQYDTLTKDERLDYLENISLAADSTYNLLENILEWSRTQMGKIDFKPDNFDLSTLINDVIILSRTQAAAKNIRLLSKVKYRTYVFADSYMVKTVLRNLVSNAIKFTEKGEVIIETEELESRVMVSVIDTGVGISDDAIDKLFKIDENIKTSGTRNEKGTGLGLILAKEFVLKNGGKIWVNRMKGQGTIFSFTLPTNE